MEMKSKETKCVATRITLNLARLIEKYCERDAYVNLADFIRDAIREKLQRDAPDLYNRLFEEANE
jgi:Arc/MetJ-type ribon-helix-helix transcriptional regulator